MSCEEEAPRGPACCAQRKGEQHGRARDPRRSNHHDARAEKQHDSSDASGSAVSVIVSFDHDEGVRGKIVESARLCATSGKYQFWGRGRCCILPLAAATRPASALALSYHGHQDGGVRVLGHSHLPRSWCAYDPEGWAAHHPLLGQVQELAQAEEEAGQAHLDPGVEAPEQEDQGRGGRPPSHAQDHQAEPRDRGCLAGGDQEEAQPEAGGPQRTARGGRQGGEGTQGRQQGRQGFLRRHEGQAHGFQAEGRQHHGSLGSQALSGPLRR